MCGFGHASAHRSVLTFGVRFGAATARRGGRLALQPSGAGNRFDGTEPSWGRVWSMAGLVACWSDGGAGDRSEVVVEAPGMWAESLVSIQASAKRCRSGVAAGLGRGMGVACDCAGGSFERAWDDDDWNVAVAGAHRGVGAVVVGAVQQLL